MKTRKQTTIRTVARAMALLLPVGYIFISSPAYAAPKNLEWRGTVNSNWDTTLNTNWFDTIRLTNSAFTSGDIVTFDDTGTGNPVNITNAVQPGAVTISANLIDYIFSGAGSITNLNNPIAGTNVVGLTKNNNGTLTILTTNGYTGVTTLNGGIVSVGQLANGGTACAIGAAANASSNLVFNGGQLQYTGPNATFNRGATLNDSGGTLAVSTATSVLTDSGVIAGTGGLAASGGGVLTLSGANTYGGGTTIPNGTVLALAGGTLGSGNVTNNGTLLFSGNSVVGNNISGSGILTNAPNITTILTGTNTFTGNIYNGTFGLTRSILVVSNSSDALDGTSQVILAGGNASTLTLAAPPGTGPSLSVPSSVTLVMVSGNSSANRASFGSSVNPCTWNGPIIIKGDGTANEVDSFGANAANAPFTINGNITATSADNYAGQVDFYGVAGGIGVMNGQFLMNTNADFFGPNNATCTWIINSTGNTCGLLYIVVGTIRLGVDNAFPTDLHMMVGGNGNVGILDLAGHNQRIAGLTNNAAGAGAAIITNSTPILSTLTYSNTFGYYTNFQLSGLFTNFSGSIGGKVGLTVAGGTLSLSGNNTYSGATTISNGTLMLSGSGSIAKSPNIIIGANATFDVSTLSSTFILGSGQILTGGGGTGNIAGSMNMAAGSSLVFNYDGSTPTLTVTNGTLTCNGSSVVTVNVPGSLLTGTSYLLVSAGAGGTVAGTPPSYVAVNGISNVAGSLSITGGQLYLTLTSYTPKNLEWNGTVNGNWDNTANTNWFDTDTSTFTNFAVLDSVMFDDNGASNVVNINDMVQPGSITVSANNTNYTFSGAGSIVGASGLTKTGTNTLTILTTNSYVGVTYVGGGILSVGQLAVGGAASAIGGAGSDPANLVINGGQLQYTGLSVSIDRGVTLNTNGGTVAVTTAGATLTTSGSIAGSGLTVAAGSGVFTLGGINSYSGGTAVNAGGTLGLSGGTFGTGDVTNNGTLLFSGANTVVNDISGSGILTNAPGSTLTLSGTNTYTGNIYSGVTNLASSTVIVGNSAALAPNTTVIIAGLNSVTLSVGAGVTTPTNATLVGFSGDINVNRCTLNFLGAGGSWSGPIVLKGDGLPTGSFAQIAAPGGAIGTVNGNISSDTNGPMNFNGQIDIRGVNSHGVVNGSFMLGAGVLWAMNDGAVWTLNSQSNTWGISDVANGGVILGVPNALPVNVPLEGNRTGLLDLNGNNQQVAGLASAGTGNMPITNSSLTYATLTCSNPANFYQANGFTNYLGVDYPTPFYAGTYTNYGGTIGGNMGLAVAAGVLSLTGTNVYTGVTTISNATLMLTGNGSIGKSTNIIIGANSTFSPSGQTLNSGQTLTGVGAAGIIGGSLNVGAGSALALNYTTGTPTLTVTNGSFNFNSGNVTVTVNVSGSLIPKQPYLLISTAGTGSMAGASPSSVIVNGLTNAVGTYGVYLSVSNSGLYLTLSQNPVVLSQYPVTYTNLFTLYAGANPAFSVLAGGGVQPFEYQWFSNGIAVNGATATNFTLANVQASFANLYCVVTNIYGSATSFVWAASVIADPTNSLGGPATHPAMILSNSPIGYWRLIEPDDGNYDGNPGALLHDYAGGNDGIYTNVYLSQPGYNTNADPSDTSALFGSYPNYPSPGSDANSIQGVDVSAPNGANGEFTIEAMVNATSQLTVNNGIVAKGYFGQEEFTLDNGAPNNAIRFEVRNAAGTVYSANSTVNNYANGRWYHLVGVCDETNGVVQLYINGALAASASIPAGSGIYNSFGTPMTIGARATSATSGLDNQFYGNINDVAVFNYALSASQVAADYNSASIPPFFSQPSSTNLILYAGGSATMSITGGGALPIGYQWYSNNAAISGATSNIYVLINAQPPNTTQIYYCEASNFVGTTTSAVVSVTILPDPTAPYPSDVLALNPIGYWRLNEPDDGNGSPGYSDGNPGVIANDYWGGNDGIYTNTGLGGYYSFLGTPPPYSPLDTNTTPAGFGLEFVNCDAYGIAGIDFSSPTNTSQAFTVEAWVDGYQQTLDAGIVTKGYGSGGEQFNLDCGSDGGTPSHSFRFFIRDASGATHAVSSSINPTFGVWHHLVGVCDEINSNMTFYIDGQSVGTSAIAPGSGILTSAWPMSIGSRASSLAAITTNVYDFQFVGFVGDVAIYNYALSASQVANQYVASGGTNAPYFNPAPPANVTNVANATLTIPVTALGTPLLGYWWTNVTTGALIASGTTNNAGGNVTLNYSNVPLSWDTNQLELTVTNAYGITNAFFTLTIGTGINTSPTNIVFAVTNNQLYLSWPANHIGWQLQAQTNNLSVGISTNWASVSISTTTNQIVIPINPTNGSVFYRLVYPPQ